MKNLKPIKKTAAILLSMSMIPVVLPLQNAAAAGNELFAEDFEAYAAGPVTVDGNKAYDSDGTLIPMTHVSLKNTDHLEIEEEDGNKYLVIYTERNNTNTRTTVSFLFDESYSGGTIDVVYDFMPRAHYACFRRFGNITYDKSNYTEKAIQRLMTQGANIITKLQNVLYGWTNDIQYSKFGGSFGTVTQTVNYGSDTDNYTFTLKYGSTVRTKTLTVSDIGTKPVFGLVWDLSSNESGGANGNDPAVTDNEVNYGVYYIDNIRVSSVGLSVEETNITPDSVISAYDNVEIAFDDAVEDDVADHVSLSKDGDVLSADEYELILSEDKKTITVSGFDYNSEYTLKVDKGLKSADGKGMVADYELSFKTNSIISHSITRERYEEGFTPSVEPFGGINYEYLISKDEAPYEPYDFSALNEQGSYKLKIVADDGNGKTQTEIIAFAIVGAIAPEAVDIHIVFSGSLGVGTVLTGQYTYFDSNDAADENMDHCTYRWYRSDSKNGVFTPIPGADGISYTLTADDEDKYFKFGVKPYSKVEPKEGKEDFSSAFASFMNPEAVNIAINGKAMAEEQLSVGYDYIDLNGDEEEISETEVIWYISDTCDGEYKEAGRGRDYHINNEDVDKWIKVAVTPQNGGSGRQDKSFYSHSVKISSKGYFSEDFEGYDPGVIAVGYANTISAERNPGGLVYKLVEGDALEVVEKDGSKVLKLTAKKGDANERQVILDFDRHYGDSKVYDVSFDYFVENNSVWFNDFGTLCDDEIYGYPNYVHSGNYNYIKLISSYRDSLYFDGNTNSSNYISGGLLASSDAIWKHQNTKIDFSQEPKPFKITTTKTSDGSPLASKETTVTYTHGGKSESLPADNISSISWRFKTNSTAGWNGQDEGNGVYYIDNVTLRSTGLSVIGSSVGEGGVVISFDDDISADAGDEISIFKAGETQPSDNYSIYPEDRKITVSGLDYNSDYEIVLNSTLKSQNGTQMLNEYRIGLKTASLMNCDNVAGRHSRGYVPDVSPVDGTTLSYFISKDEGEFSEYDQTPIDETGKYRLKAVAVDINGKIQTEIIDFEIVGAVPPEAENVKIGCGGTIDVGTVLNGTYKYFDVNDDNGNSNEDYCEYKWYRSDSEDGVFVPISGANGISYTLTAADEDKYIKFSVRPYSKEEPKEGGEYLSAAFASFMNPKALNVKISGKMATDEQLTVSYEYFDLNGDKEITEGENATTVIWYTSQVKGSTYNEVGRGTSYTITEADSDKWIKACVIPKNDGGGSQNKMFYSEETAGAFSPVASDVRLIGNANVNSTITVDYKFYDANQDPESGSTVEWYVDGVSVSHDTHYTISSNDQGRSVYAVVTPRSSVKPNTGTPVQSNGILVSNRINSSVPGSGSGGGGGGGGGGSRTGSSAGGTGNNVTLPSGSSGQDNANDGASVKKGFKDISGHWAEQVILKMVEEGIVFGRSDDEFAPEDKITRAEFATLICRMLKLERGTYKFSDVADDSWYSESIAAVAAAGYMKGDNSFFRPEENITREEMAVAIAAITSAHGIEGSGAAASFTDFDTVSDWAKNAVSIMADIGIINGMDDNSFVPRGEATRAQTVMMLSRLQDILNADD